jgi:RNA polymerase sigma factor (sigma-70 family)
VQSLQQHCPDVQVEAMPLWKKSPAGSPLDFSRLDDRDKLEQLFRTHYKKIFNIVKGAISGRSAADVEDQISRCFVKILEKYPEQMNESSLTAYLVRCACNGLLDEIRHAKFEFNPGWTVDAEDGSEFHPMMLLQSQITPPSELALKRFQDCIGGKMESFPVGDVQHKVALTMYVLQEASIEEVGIAIGRTATATRTLLSKINRRLLTYLAPCREHFLT